jgi:hypothetical protein
VVRDSPFLPAHSSCLHCRLGSYLSQQKTYVGSMHLTNAHLKNFLYRAVRKAIQVNKLLKLFSYFGKKTLTISCNNVDNLWNGMKEVDRKLFNFNMDDFHWEHYWKNALKYGRVYLVKDPLETLPWARKKIMLFAILHYSLMVLFCCWLFMFVYRML